MQLSVRFIRRMSCYNLDGNNYFFSFFFIFRHVQIRNIPISYMNSVNLFINIPTLTLPFLIQSQKCRLFFCIFQPSTCFPIFYSIYLNLLSLVHFFLHEYLKSFFHFRQHFQIFRFQM